jgi:hypothetical protein
VVERPPGNQEDHPGLLRIADPLRRKQARPVRPLLYRIARIRE